MPPTRQEIEQAKQYAYHSLKIYMYNKYRHLLKDNVVFETRKADREKDDVFIPPDLDYRVVDKSGFTERGCTMISCFPYREDLKPCEPDDELRWIRIGFGHSLACQEACKYGMVDVEFYSGKCMLMNPNKKLLAMLPEDVFGMKTRHNFHAGLDLKDGHLQLNAEYCRSYGQSFDDGDCYVSGGQQFGEILLGSTIMRSMTYRTVDKSTLPPVPALPQDLKWPTKRVKRQLVEVEEEDDENVILSLTRDIAIDYGVQLGLKQVHRFLKTRAPNMMAKMGKSILLRHSMGALIARSYLSTAVAVSRASAVAVSAASGVLAGVAIISLLLDIFDPFEFNRVLDKRTLRDIDRNLDREYFEGKDRFDIEMTLEEFWDIIEPNVSEQALFLEDKMKEYLASLHSGPLPGTTRSLFSFTEKKKSRNNDTLLIMVLTLLTLSCIAIEYMIYFCTLILLAFLAEHMLKEYY